MPTAPAQPHDRRARRRGAGQLVADPHHLPRWWPRVARVEDVDRRRLDRGAATDQGRAACAPTSGSWRSKRAASGAVARRSSRARRSSASSCESRPSWPASRAGRAAPRVDADAGARSCAALRASAGSWCAGATQAPLDEALDVAGARWLAMRPSAHALAGAGASDAHAARLPAAARRCSSASSASTRRPAPRVALEDVRLPTRRCPRALRERLAARRPCATTVPRACCTRPGKSLPRPRAPAGGRRARRPRRRASCPRSHEEVRAVLDACAAPGVAVVPFGGGTSVVGGVEPLRGAHGGGLARPRRAGRRRRARRALAGWPSPGGLRGPSSRRAPASAGLTLGHFPQCFEYATVGGCAATRSAGQASTGYGRFDELVLGRAPGRARRRPRPARRARRAPRAPSCAGWWSAPRASSA